jgi:hypothetical protein
MRKNPQLYSALGAAAQQQGKQQGQQGQQEPAAAAAAGAPPPPPQQQPLVKPEVLAPAGGWPQLRAAVENGADAVYFGLSDFNARARAANFDPQELPEVRGGRRRRRAVPGGAGRRWLLR